MPEAILLLASGDSGGLGAPALLVLFIMEAEVGGAGNSPLEVAARVDPKVNLWLGGWRWLVRAVILLMARSFGTEVKLSSHSAGIVLSTKTLYKMQCQKRACQGIHYSLCTCNAVCTKCL